MLRYIGTVLNLMHANKGYYSPPSFVSSCLRCIGTTLNFVAGGKISQAVAYSIANAAPMVAALWGILWFKEFKGAPASSVVLLVLMFMTYSGAIASIAVSSGSV